ncbi:MAG TPA: efflux RND transporter periplasmic adaptor subunit [Terracidiphilus sp.]|jgi:RND family efflux transporter MFP subunit|nr:efflux RND transporter periplasmic adaptor subunit [Terracidiphilus sp.]
MTNASQSQPQPGARQTGHDHESAPDHPAISGRGASVALVIVGIAVVGLAGYGIWKRHHNNTVLAETTTENAPPTVIAIPPKEGALVDTLTLPGNVTAYTDSPLFARTSGYLAHWYYDIGARVKKGALLAEIDTPELDQQVMQARADLATAEANAGNAKVQAERYKGLVTSDAVSQLDTDTFVTQAASTSTAVQSAKANLERLKQLQGFEKIYAPFNGVVTARGVDTGQLIDVGATTQLFHMQALDTLRVYTNVPEVYTKAIRHGEKIDLSFPQYPGRMFEGTLVRTADAIDPANRTLLVEIDVDNRKGELMPGSLAQVHFKAPVVAQTFILPASALVFRRQGIQVGTIVDKDNATVAHLIPITIGEDDGATVQVVAGLSANDRVIQDPPDSIIEGEKLTVVKPSQQNEGETPPNPQPQGQPKGNGSDSGGKL